ncbi:high mobility group box domain-containing protein, partial [Pisolithus orientalis]|uniref:high mobility group box domain-containing protein n=1 Tax=Pisolithus orientalis TaxID=936130 RepID=UPI0022244A0F
NKSPNHIPRPRNAFMLFRSAFAAAQKIRTTVEHDNRHITRIIAHCWNRLSDADKQVWREKAAAEKALHAEKYPNYRFSPIGRTTKPIKRNVRRNGIEDKKRCEKVAELLLAGKSGEELEDAVKQVDISLKTEALDHAASRDAEESPVNDHDWQSQLSDSEDSNIPPFRSPLLPP